MRTSALLEELASRLLANNVISMQNDFAGANMPPLRVDETDFWIHENHLGHSVAPLNTKRKRIFYTMVQYNLYVPFGSGTRKLDEKTSLIEQTFDPNDPSCSDIEGDGFTAKITGMKVDEDMAVGDWWMRPVLLNVAVAAHEA